MMISDVSVKRPVFAIMMTAALLVLGAFSYRELGLDLMPKTDAPVVTVNVNLPGASAEEIETQITKRVEEAVNTISGIDEISSHSYDALSGPLHERSHSSSVQRRLPFDVQSCSASSRVTLLVGIAPGSFGYGRISR